MKKNFIIVALLILFFILLLIFYYSKIVEDQIIKANYCQIDQDCLIVDFGCPFGCGSYINKKEKNKLTNLIDIYKLFQPSCEYTCLRKALPECKNNQCVAKQCELDKYYQASIFVDEYDKYNSFECDCPLGSNRQINEKGLICLIKK